MKLKSFSRLSCRPACRLKPCCPSLRWPATNTCATQRGALVPVETIPAKDLLIDEQVRKIIRYTRELHATMSRFKEHTFGDVVSLQDLLAQEYGAKLGGAKGNVQMTTFDGTEKVSVQVADLITFGPELQAAKQLIDQCMLRWGAESNANLRAIVNRAFQVDQQGQINQGNLYMLLRLEIDDADWQNAMQAIRDSIRVVGSKKYLRFSYRASADGQWITIPLDLAAI